MVASLSSHSRTENKILFSFVIYRRNLTCERSSPTKENNLGVPEQMKFGGRPKIKCSEFTKYANTKGTQIRHCPLFGPRKNGVVESSNQTNWNLAQTNFQDNSNWHDDTSKFLVQLYRGFLCRVLGKSPSEVFFNFLILTKWHSLLPTNHVLQLNNTQSSVNISC